MTETKKYKNQIYGTLFPISFIFIDQLCHSYIIVLISRESSLSSMLLILIMLAAQIIFSPVQSGLSDFFSRKKSILFSIFASTIALSLLVLNEKNLFGFFIIPIALLIKGIFGNTLGLSWAAIADRKINSFQYSFSASIAAMASGYLLLHFLPEKRGWGYSHFIVISLLLTSAFLAKRFYFDSPRKPVVSKVSVTLKTLLDQIFDIWKYPLKNKRIRFAIITFLFWEVSFYSIFMFGMDFSIAKLHTIALSMIFGTYSAVFFLLAYSPPLKKALDVSVGLTALSTIPVILTITLSCYSDLIGIVCYFFYGLGSTLLDSFLFSMLSSEFPSQDQGKIYGLIDSADSIAIFFVIFVIFMYHLQGSPGNPVTILTALSSGLFLISLVSYAAFRRTSIVRKF